MQTGTERVRQSAFRPAWWLRHRHAQTIFPSLPWAFRYRPELVRETLELPDGDVTAIDWVKPSEDLPMSAPLLVILHGLESSSQSPYARMLMQAATHQRWHCCVLHFRDCGDYRNRLPRRYHAGETNDIRFFLSALKQRGFGGPLLACGYSLGGNVLLKYLGETGKTTPLEAAAAICVPLELAEAAMAINSGFSEIYQRYLIKSMKLSLERKFDAHTAAFDWRSAMSAKSIADFDAAVTAPLHGFSSLADYYNRCSSIRFLKSIAIPTLIVNALDDPFMTPKVLPEKDGLSESTVLEISASGGHVGFIEGGSPWNPRYFLPRRIVGFFGDEVGLTARGQAASTSFIDNRTRP